MSAFSLFYIRESGATQFYSKVPQQIDITFQSLLHQRIGCNAFFGYVAVVNRPMPFSLFYIRESGATEHLDEARKHIKMGFQSLLHQRIGCNEPRARRSARRFSSFSLFYIRESGATMVTRWTQSPISTLSVSFTSENRVQLVRCCFRHNRRYNFQSLLHQRIGCND